MWCLFELLFHLTTRSFDLHESDELGHISTLLFIIADLLSKSDRVIDFVTTILTSVAMILLLVQEL